MSSGNYNHGFLAVAVGGKAIEELLDVEIPEPDGDTVEAILAGGQRGIGHRVSTMANVIKPTITIAHPSSSEFDLEALRATKQTVDFVFQYEDPDELPDGALIGFTSANVKVNRTGSHGFTESPDAREYTMNCIGYTMEFKNKGTITVDAAGNVSVGA